MKESDIRDKETFGRYLRLVEEEVKDYFDKRRFITVPCVCCASRRCKVQFEKMGFKYVLCDDCGTLYANPRPSKEDLIVFNTTSKSAGLLSKEIILSMAECRKEKIFRPRAELAAKRLSGQKSSVLGDIGSGAGLFLEEMRKIMPQSRLVAIEPSSEMAAICRKKGFEVIDKAIEDINKTKEKFDLLSAFELLEHLHSPGVLFRNACEMLKPGGLFLITTLNCEGFDIQVLWEHSKNIYPAQHINFFNPRSLQRALEDAGFRVEELTTPGRLDWDIVENTIKDSSGRPGRLWVNFAKNAGREAKEDLQLFLSKYGLSSHMMVLARKDKKDSSHG